LNGGFKVTFTNGSAQLREVALSQPDGLTFVERSLRLRHVPDRPLCGG
jgi:hypothetical protein